MSSSVLSLRGKVAGLSRDRRADDPDLVAARSNLKAERFADYIRKAISTAPPLTTDQRSRLASLILEAS
jgi:hypothetical protein